MLVLTRKHQEKIRIGENIVITVLKTKGKTVRLGIEAPAEVPVIRGELSFAGQSVSWTDETDGAPAEPASQAHADQSHVDRIRDHWPTKSQPNRDEAHGTMEEAGTPRVSLQRVPRDQFGCGPSSDAAGKGLLRALLDRRSVTA